MFIVEKLAKAGMRMKGNTDPIELWEYSFVFFIFKVYIGSVYMY